MTDLTYIAGGSKGLGAALLKTFSQYGHQVFEFSRSGKGDKHIDCDFNDTQATVRILQNHFSNSDVSAVKHINLIINTATLSPFGSIANTDNETIQQHLNINVESTLSLIQAFLQAFQNHPAKKTLTYMSSGAARRAIPGLAMYSASKAFFERFVDTLGEEQLQETQPIRCMIINPGVMNTGMQSEIRAQQAEDFPMVGLWQQWYEQGKLADPNDIAAVCYRLISAEGENRGYYVAQDYLSS